MDAGPGRRGRKVDDGVLFRQCTWDSVGVLHDAAVSLEWGRVRMSRFNMSGQRAVSRPLGEAGGMPAGVHLVARI